MRPSPRRALVAAVLLLEVRRAEDEHAVELRRERGDLPPPPRARRDAMITEDHDAMIGEERR
jgi:hypothetical protein